MEEKKKILEGLRRSGNPVSLLVSGAIIGGQIYNLYPEAVEITVNAGSNQVGSCFIGKLIHVDISHIAAIACT